jgi:hypothetical protein
VDAKIANSVKSHLEQSFTGDNKQWPEVHCATSQCLLVCPYQLAAQSCNNLAANSSTTNGITLQLHHLHRSVILHESDDSVEAVI